MAINPNEDTEFNEALRKHGILPPLEPTPPSPSPPPSPKFDDILDEYTPDELHELGEDIQDDEAERYVEQFRRQRLAEMKLEERRGRFGRVIPIGREDYTREITDASDVNEEEDEKKLGTGVVCFLYKDGIPRSDRAYEHVRTLAAKHPRTKFVSIVGDKCIPDLPDSRVPMFIVYRRGEIINQITSRGADKERKLEGPEVMLAFDIFSHEYT
ncbi:thioredoxin-like protein [Artomyces pyxidatus]|uniref:Thioredoxin-like protein n=1 Tax=Artomyces pyxidatus TaxID=48021 RepID=A0ACB8SRR2_9AGAM|nr:thioredoxin-like protein [Artomyces pyxidatus]